MKFLTLPDRISDFERTYLRRMNRIAAVFFLLHVPPILVLAALNGIGLASTAALLAGALSFPVLARLSFESPRAISVSFGITAMLVGGVLVHVGQGPVQIEMHFHFFVLIALLAVFANPMVIVAAALTVAGHHAAVWLLAPASVFNYQAAWWVVAIHAGFVVIESVAAAFIARTFFDNVIGLERIVEKRTAELASRNEQMRRVLDNVDQGLIPIDRDGVILPEFSAMVTRWFGDVAPGTTFGALLRRADPRVADIFEAGLSQVIDAILPLEITIDQLPRELRQGAQSFVIAYTALPDAAGELGGLLTIVTDVTSQLARERLEAEQRELATIFQSITRDRSGFLTFWDEADRYMQNIATSAEDATLVRRSLHTLKGNAAFFGLRSLAELVHEVEQHVIEDGKLVPDDAQALMTAWRRVKTALDSLLTDRRSNLRVEIEVVELDGALDALNNMDPHAQIARRLESWRLEPVRRRFERIAEQLRTVGARLGRARVEVVVDDGDVLFDPRHWENLWSSFIHLARNAVDHGVEMAEEREENGKPASGRVELRARREADRVVLSIADDGRGIDWRAVAAKARAHGIPADTEEEREAALFFDGVTSRDEATETSGRGVGMGAVKDAVAGLGGEMKVTSVEGKGTTVTISVPATIVSAQASRAA